MRLGLRYTAIVALVAATVGGLASIRLAGDALAAAWIGAAVGFVVQAAGFWLLFVWAFPRRRMLAHLLGFALRFAVVVGAALLWMPVASIPAAPVLLALVTVVSVATFFEPVVLQMETTRAARQGTAPAAVR